VHSVPKGHLNNFAVPGNDQSLWWFFNQVKWQWLRSLRRRSQRAYLNWERYIRFVDRFLPPIRILHPLRCHRFDARTRGEEPGALAAHAGICPGAAGNGRRYRDH
jgi:RNA-directed DNA polymerase